MRYFNMNFNNAYFTIFFSIISLDVFGQLKIEELDLIIPAGLYSSPVKIQVSQNKQYLKLIGFRSDTSIIDLHQRKLVFSSFQSLPSSDTCKFHDLGYLENDKYAIKHLKEGQLSEGDTLSFTYKNKNRNIVIPFALGEIMWDYKSLLVLSKLVTHDKPELLIIDLNSNYRWHFYGQSLAMELITDDHNGYLFSKWNEIEWSYFQFKLNKNITPILDTFLLQNNTDLLSDVDGNFLIKKKEGVFLKVNTNDSSAKFFGPIATIKNSFDDYLFDYSEVKKIMALYSYSERKLYITYFDKMHTTVYENLIWSNSLEFPQFMLSSDGKLLVIWDCSEYVTESDAIYAMNLENKEIMTIPTFTDYTNRIYGLNLDNENNIYYSKRGSIFKRDSKLGLENIIYLAPPKNDYYSSFSVHPEDSILVLNSFLLNKADFLNLSNNRLFSLICLKNNNWLVKLSNSPYFMCSKDASKMLHYVTPSLKVIGFEQLDPVYNRPDIVLDSIGKYFGGADQELVANYRQSWEKRIDRLGLDKEKLGKGEIAVPNAEIVGADDIAYENKEGKLNIKVSANDSKYTLRHFNVFVNEVPLYGSAGISVAQLKKQVWDTTVSIPLSIGENKIQVSVMNELGLENFKYPTYVNYAPAQELTAKTYYIGIGVNEFKESSHNLKYCVKDVTDLAQSLGGPNTEVNLFTNQQVTKENILALKAYLNKTTVNDKVIISCSSHGLLDDSLNFYLAMHDVDFDNPKARGLKYEELENLLDGIPARQKLLLLDACNSGENDKSELLKQELKQKEQSMDSTQLLVARGVIVELEEKNKNNFKKLNELFVNVRNNTGSVIISAAGGQESALEAIQVDGKTIENGAFTFSILECLKQNQGKELKVNTLKQYAEKRVEEITNGKQKPTSRQETMEINWKINE